MCTNMFEQLWMAWNSMNTEFQDGNSETLYEVHLLYEYFACWNVQLTNGLTLWIRFLLGNQEFLS